MGEEEGDGHCRDGEALTGNPHPLPVQAAEDIPRPLGLHHSVDTERRPGQASPKPQMTQHAKTKAAAGAPLVPPIIRAPKTLDTIKSLLSAAPEPLDTSLASSGGGAKGEDAFGKADINDPFRWFFFFFKKRKAPNHCGSERLWIGPT